MRHNISNPSLEAQYKRLHRDRFYIKEDSSLADYVESHLEEYKAMQEYQDLMNNHHWTEDEVFQDVLGKLKQDNQRTISAHFKHMVNLTDVPTDPVWGQYSYQEIIDMAEQGAHVPDDILQWAKAMANDDIVSYDMSDIGSDEDVLNNLDADMVDDRGAETKQQIKRYSQIADKQKAEAEEKVTETENANIQMEKMQENLEDMQKSAAERVEMYQNELSELENKAKAGEELTPEEQIKYRAISGNIEDENHNIVLVTNQVDKEIESLFDIMNDDFNQIDTYNKLSEQLDIKAENFVSKETKLNSGTLKSSLSNVGFFSNPYQSSALGGSLGFNLLDISRNLYLQTSLLNNNMFTASNIMFKLDMDVDNIDNVVSTDNTNDEIIDNTENAENSADDEENNNVNADNDTDDAGNANSLEKSDIEEQPADNSVVEDEFTEEENVGAENQNVSTVDADNSELGDVAEGVDNSTPTIANEENGLAPDTEQFEIEELESADEVSYDNNETNNEQEMTMTDAMAVEEIGNAANITASDAVARTEQAENDLAQSVEDTEEHISSLNNKQNKINSVAKQSEALQSEVDSLKVQRDSLLPNIEAENDLQNVLSESELSVPENNNTPITDNPELAALVSKSETLEKDIEKNESSIYVLSNSSNAEASVVRDDVSVTDNVQAQDQADAQQNAEAHKTQSSNILELAQKFIMLKNMGAMLMLSPWTAVRGIQMYNTGRYGENASLVANEAVMLAHGNLINSGTSIGAFRNGLFVKESKTSAAASLVENEANEANAQADDMKNNLADNQLPEPGAAEANQTQVVIEQSNSQANTQNADENVLNENASNENDNEGSASQDVNKKESPRDESFSVQQAITTAMTVSDAEIEAETVEDESSNDNLEILNEQIAEQINSSKPEYMKNPGIVDDEEIQSEEFTPDMDVEQMEVIAADSTKESIRAEVRSAVLELMQSTLSETNKNEQKKDSDTDKRHKLFTQFEREKKDALRKTVQKINRARDAR